MSSLSSLSDGEVVVVRSSAYYSIIIMRPLHVSSPGSWASAWRWPLKGNEQTRVVRRNRVVDLAGDDDDLNVQRSEQRAKRAHCSSSYGSSSHGSKWPNHFLGS